MQREALAEYLTQVRKLTDIERQSVDRPKTGVFLGRYAVNPVNGERIPVWAADYVLPDYGTGAIMAVPAHDQRDLDFARTFGLPVRVVVDTGEADPAVSGIATHGDGTLVNSGPIDGLDKCRGDRQDHRDPGRAGRGPGGGQLPAARLAGLPAAVLGDAHPDRLLPGLRRGPGARRAAAGGPAGSAWAGPGAQGRLAAGRRRGLGRHRAAPSAAAPPGATPTPWTPSSTLPGTSCGTARPLHRTARSTREVRRWAPVDLYVGGVEHAILHLLYSRFFVKVLYDMGMVDFTEPFTRLLNQGQVINQGRAMSKSLGNGVDLGEQLAAVRGRRDPADDDLRQPARGRHRLGGHEPRCSGQVPRPGLAAGRDGGRGTGPAEQAAAPATASCARSRHRTIDEVTRLVEASRLNVAVARLMELASATRRAIDSGPGAADPAVREAAEILAVLLSIFAPYTAEECWELLGHKPSVALARLAVRRSGAAGRGPGHLRGAGQRQGARQAGSSAADRRGRTA